MKKYNYIEGDIVGELIFINKEKSINKAGRAKFRCRCGKEFICETRNAANLITKSCGCMRYILSSMTNTIHKPIEYTSIGVRKIPHLPEETINRFWNKVAITANADLCWNWTASGNKRYGMLRIGKTSYKANRISYYLHNAKDPMELNVLHSCHNSMCCNPKHLSLGTHDDNMKDMVLAGRSNNQYTKYKNIL